MEFSGKPVPPDETVCQEADRLVSGDRGGDYGHPLDDFCKTAVLWGVHKGVSFTPEDVAIMMGMVKQSREMNKHKRDNLVDLCGYTKCLDMVIAEKERRLQAGWTFNSVTGRWKKPEAAPGDRVNILK